MPSIALYRQAITVLEQSLLFPWIPTMDTLPVPLDFNDKFFKACAFAFKDSWHAANEAFPRLNEFQRYGAQLPEFLAKAMPAGEFWELQSTNPEVTTLEKLTLEYNRCLYLENCVWATDRMSLALNRDMEKHDPFSLLAN